MQDRTANAFEFQPTLPLRGATELERVTLVDAMFQPTLPLRGATSTSELLALTSEFQPTLPLRGATPPGGLERQRLRVSTHAPLAGSDVL